MIKEMIIEYLPTVMAALGFVATILRLKRFSFKKDTESLETKMDTIIEDNRALRHENRELRNQLSILIDKSAKVTDYERKRKKD